MHDPTPTEDGTYWAVLRDPHEQPEGEEWMTTGEWEAVRVVDSSSADDEVSFIVFVPGVERGQPLEAFEWGPRIPDHVPDRTRRGGWRRGNVVSIR